jgi:phosphatidylinositol alpha 1,6-mannosyltransferase
MRMALVAESFLPAADGTTTTVKAVADRLIDQGHQVLLIAMGPGLTTYRGSRVARVAPVSQDGLGRRVRAALEEFRPDLVHVTSPGRIGRKALKHGRRMAIPTVVVQQTPVTGVTADYWRAKVADRADRMLVTTPWMAAELERLGVSAALWTPGVDSRAFTPQLRDLWLHDSWARAKSADGPRVVVGYAGSLHKRHGVRRLPELAVVPGIRIVVIGDGPQRGWLEDRLPAAKFTGPLETGDLARALASMDVVVHPGATETCCHVLREAAASGVPVAAPRAGGARHVVRHLETGLLYDPDGGRGLRDAVTSLAADRHRGLLGGRARELAQERDWVTAVDELLLDHYPRAFWRRPDAA